MSNRLLNVLLKGALKGLSSGDTSSGSQKKSVRQRVTGLGVNAAFGVAGAGLGHAVGTGAIDAEVANSALNAFGAVLQIFF